MALDEHTRQRIRGIATGSIPPETGMERHFRRVCLGEANPLTAEEREWYEFVQQPDSAPRHAETTIEAAMSREQEARRRAEAAQQEAQRRCHETDRRVADLEAQVARSQVDRAAIEQQGDDLRRTKQDLQAAYESISRFINRLRLKELENQALRVLLVQTLGNGLLPAITMRDAEKSRMNEKDLAVIEEHGYLRALADQGLLSPEIFDELAERSGLAVALHNLEKIRRVIRDGVPLPGGSKDISALVRESRCNACDRPLSFCICGR